MNKKLRISMLVLALSLFVVAITFSKKDEEEATNAHADYVFGPFETGQEVTQACLECHDDAAEDFMKTRHWNWLGDEFEDEEHGKVRVGKKNLINNFCIAVPSNYPRCTSCHPGYGWKDDTFDFTKKENIDCLVCHESTGEYKKVPTGAGAPAEGLDLEKIAQSVGKPTIQNCGQCHFNGGGGEGVKHGDLDPTLLKAGKEVDVHMGGLDMQCIDCHKSENHKIQGASHGSLAQGTNHISCENCHDPASKIHKKNVLNKHTDAIACETCHIPEIGRNFETKTFWDWSTAGQRDDEKDDEGKVTYAKKKGDFKWEGHVVPDYQWFNGKADYYFAGDKIDPNSVVYLNKMEGKISDKNSKIAPFKKMVGKQPYDKVHNYLIVPKLFGEGGYWKTYDWVKASKLGMEEVGLEFSGEVGFVETAMYWSQNHAVAPADDALGCMDCHTKGDRMNWEALGYDGDPMKKGGRKRNKLLKD